MKPRRDKITCTSFKECSMRWFLIALLLLLPLPALAQLTTGNLFVTVIDANGSPLPGVTLTLYGVGAPQVQVTDSHGRFRFLNLSPGEYGVQAQLEGFTGTTYPHVTVNLGRNTEIKD